MEQEPEKKDNKLKCPKCGSTDLMTGKHGFSAGKAVGGAILTGGIGVLLGLHGAGRVEATCLNCAHKWRPLEVAKQRKKDESLAYRKAFEKERRNNLTNKARRSEDITKWAVMIILFIGLIMWYWSCRVD